jgi:hypothetical protein
MLHTHEIVETMGIETWEFLPAFPLSAGCYSTSSLHGIEKEKALYILYE